MTIPFNRSLSIALVAENLRRDIPGGIGVYARELTRALVNQSAKVELVASSVYGGSDPLRVIAPVTTTRLPHVVTANLWDRELVRVDPRIAFKNDILHATSMHFPSPVFDKPTLSIFVHDLAWKTHPDFFSPRGLKFHDRGLERALRHAQAFLVPSKRSADALIAAGAPSPKVFVVAEGCNHLPKAMVAREERFLLAVSTIEPRKNLVGLFAAYSKARSSYSGKEVFPELLVVGATGWNSTEHGLPKLIPEGVQLLGGLGDQQLSDLLQRALGLIYVPILEGYGLPPLEAMLHGVACIVSDAVPSVVETNTTGHALIVDPSSVDEIASAITKLVVENSLRAELVESGRHYVEHLTWENSAREHYSIWEGL